MNNLTYKELPDNLLTAMLAGALTLPEATGIWEEGLMADGEMRVLPPHLWPAAQRLHLFEMDLSQRRMQ